MDKQGFINYTSSFSPTGSGKAGSYAKAIDILNDIFSNVSIKDYPTHNLYSIINPEVIEDIRNYVSFIVFRSVEQPKTIRNIQA